MKNTVSLRKLAAWFPAAGLMALIFYFSAMPGEQSGALSSPWAARIVRAVVDVLAGVSGQDALRDLASDSQVLQAAEVVIRKSAHMAEYALLGAALCFGFWINGYRKTVCHAFHLPAQFAAFLYAATDELHQLYVPGRTGKWSDVLVDSAGACIGICIFVCLYHRKVFRTDPENLEKI